MAVDPFDDQRFEMLKLQREAARGDAQMQNALIPFAAREHDAQRECLATQGCADDRRPIGGQGRGGEATLAQRLGDDPA